MPRSAPQLTIRMNSATESAPKFLTKGISIKTMLDNFEVFYYDGSYYFLELGKTTEYKNMSDWGAGTWMAFPMVYAIKPDAQGNGWLTYGDGDHWTRQPIGKEKVGSFADATRKVLDHFKAYAPNIR